MRKGRNDGKDIYRKKAFSGKIVRDFKKKYLEFIEELKKIPEKPPINRINFVIGKFGVFGEKNPDLKAIVFCRQDKLREMMIDLGNKGANLNIICGALEVPKVDDYLKDGHPSGLLWNEGQLNPYWNEMIENFHAKRKEFLKQERVIKNAIKVITSLKPITRKHFYDNELTRQNELDFVNTKLMEAQKTLYEFERVSNIYFNAKAVKDGLIGYPEKWGWPSQSLF